MGNKSSKLVEAARVGDIAKVKELVQSGVDVKAKDEDGDTALLWAALRGHLDVVRYLCEQGADKKAKDEDGETALIKAAQRGRLDVVRYLCEQGADKDAKGWMNNTALIQVARGGRLDMVRYLVDQGADKEAKGWGGNTALIGAAVGGHLDVVRCLVEQGADVNVKNKYGTTALTWAAQRGNLDVVRYLCEQGADVNAKDEDGDTALIKAAREGHLDVVRYLVEQGADKDAKNNSGGTALLWAAQSGNLDMVRYLCEQGADKEAKGWIDNTALLKAAQEGHRDVVRYLVEQGADVNAKTNRGNTALIWAAVGGHLDVVRCLCEQGADGSCLDSKENSALVLLLLRDDTKEEILLPVVKLLLESGVPPLQSNNNGKSAKSIAREKKFYGVLDLLDEYAAKPRPVLREFPEEEDANWVISHDAIAKTGALAVGGFGTVYRATWAHTEVVVKEITVVEMRRLLREVNTWRGLTHDNVVQFYGANHLEEPYFIVSKYASNGELVPYLKREKAEGRSLVWRKLREVAAGLIYLHQRRIVHGDLKGNNIVVSKDGTAMLTDFGLSFIESGSCSVMKMKDLLGAMAWRAPEFAKMTTMTPTRKSDVYSLGMCIIEAVTCETPLSGYTNDEIRSRLRHGKILVKKPDAMTDVQWSLVEKMLAISPDARPELEDVICELDQFAKAEVKAEAEAACPY